jgi:hypothetical protein
MASKHNVTRLCMLALALAAHQVGSQTLETVGTRASGMAGAFVAVSSDSSAVWWNPGALPAGPFVDASFGRTAIREGDSLPGLASRASALALVLPVAGVHVARYDLSSAVSEGGVATVLSRVAVTQTGFTLAQTLVSGVHVGGTVKYLRGVGVTGRRIIAEDQAIEASRTLEGGGGEGRWDVDLGLLAVYRAWRVGLLARHLAAPSFGSGTSVLGMDRHARVGMAFDAAAIDGPPLVIAADIDLTEGEGPDPRRDVALGLERWVHGGRLGVRTGVRASTTGPARPAAAVGASVLVKSSLFLEFSGTASRDSRARGWGATVRLSF